MLSQPAALNGPEEAWLRRRIEEYERTARAALLKQLSGDEDRKFGYMETEFKNSRQGWITPDPDVVRAVARREREWLVGELAKVWGCEREYVEFRLHQAMTARQSSDSSNG